MLLLSKDCKYYFTTTYNTKLKDTEYDKKTCFEVDELIFPVIQLFNLKGYKTEFCCAGHYYRNDLKDLEYYDDDIEQYKISFYDIGDMINDESWSHPYILFEEGIVKDLPNKDTLPKGWEIQYSPKLLRMQVKLYEEIGKLHVYKKPTTYKYKVGLYYEDIYKLIKHSRKDNDEVDLYKFYIKIVNVMSKLYKWVETLPDNK